MEPFPPTGCLSGATNLKPHVTRLAEHAASQAGQQHLPQLAALAAAVVMGGLTQLLEPTTMQLHQHPQLPLPPMHPPAPRQPSQLLQQNHMSVPAARPRDGPQPTRRQQEELKLEGAAQLLHGFVLLYIQSLKPGGTSAADVVYHCKCQGLTGDALTIQRVLETLVNEVQIYRNQQGNYAAL
jgi:hypothetical protein